MGWMGCVGCEKLRRDFVAQTFVLITPVQYVLRQVSCSYETIPNALKYYETHWNIGIGSNGVDWLFSLRKIPMWLCGTNFSNNCLVHPILHRHSCSYETIPNAPKYYETDWYIYLGSTRVDWVCLLRNIPSWLRGINFCINCTSSPRFAPSFMQLWNDPKCTQILWNTPKHLFRVKWGGLGAFVAKNPDVT